MTTNNFSYFIRSGASCASVGLALFLAGCGQGGPGGQSMQRPPSGPADVLVTTITPQKITLTTELPGRLSSFRVAEVRPQVNGVILKRMFAEGADVQEGQQLYQIDPAPYQAALDSAQAGLEHAQAELVSAQGLAERDKSLSETNAVSKQDYVTAVSGQQQAEADVASGEAAVETAKVNLTYTKVLAPISGRTGRSITEGALVTANQATLLVTVTQLDPIYVDIPQSANLLLRLERELADGKIKSAGGNQAEVNLTLEDGTQFDQKGKLLFSEATVDQGTGSVILRAVFPNPQHLLLPGMFVRAEVEEGVNENALLVPQQAVTHDPHGNPTALVVNNDDKVELRVLTTERAIKDDWLVSSGISAGDRVIVEGLQKVQPGATVRATEAPASNTAPVSQE
jgi:membrane fusion protein (multidrug efflux system)